MIDFTSYSLRYRYRLQQKMWCYFKRNNISRQGGKVFTTFIDTSHAQGNSYKLLLFEHDIC